MSETNFLAVADTTDIDLGHSQSVHFNGVDILICHTEEGFFAVEDLCTHSMIPLCGGEIQGNYITCPLHGAVFDLTDGSVQHVQQADIVSEMEWNLFNMENKI